MPGLRAGLACVLVLGFALPFAQAVAQQAPGPETSLILGPSDYDLSTGSGTSFAVSAALAFRPTHGVLVVEPSLGYLTYHNDFHQRAHWFFPELSFQAEAAKGNLRPFIGGGGGVGIGSRVGGNRYEATLHALAGLRLRLGSGWGARVEVRLRSVHPFSGHTADVGIGVVRGIM